MSTYILFFGKSQAFKLEAYGSNGIIEDFDTVIKDFDLLESRWLTVDSADNKQMLGKYQFSNAGRKFSLLKLYSYAQATGGSRVDGSIFGVAILSEMPISLVSKNIDVLDALKRKFADLCLINSKFITSNFRSQTSRIWAAFAEQYSLDFIQFDEQFNTLPTDSKPTYVLVNQLSRLPEGIHEFELKSHKLYITEDKDHLERTLQKWQFETEAFFESDNKLIDFKTLKDTIAPKPTIIKEFGGEAEIQLAEVSEELKQTQGLLKKQLRKVMVLYILIGGLVLISTAALILGFNEEKEIANPVVVESSVSSPKRIMETDSAFISTDYLLNKVLSDSNERQNLIQLANMLASGRKANKVSYSIKTQADIMNIGKKLKLDTLQLQSLINGKGK